MVLLISSYNFIVIHNFTEGIAGELHYRSYFVYSCLCIFFIFLFLWYIVSFHVCVCLGNNPMFVRI